MNPRRTYESNTVFQLPGSNEDSDLWVATRRYHCGHTVLASTWVPTDEERQRIANGENIELRIFGETQPPVSVVLSDIPIGKRPKEAPAEFDLREVTPMTRKGAIEMGRAFIAEFEASSGEQFEGELLVRYRSLYGVGEEIRIDRNEPPAEPPPDPGPGKMPPLNPPV